MEVLCNEKRKSKDIFFDHTLPKMEKEFILKMVKYLKIL